MQTIRPTPSHPLTPTIAPRPLRLRLIALHNLYICCAIRFEPNVSHSPAAAAAAAARIRGQIVSNVTTGSDNSFTDLQPPLPSKKRSQVARGCRRRILLLLRTDDDVDDDDGNQITDKGKSTFSACARRIEGGWGMGGGFRSDVVLKCACVCVFCFARFAHTHTNTRHALCSDYTN